MKRFVVVLSLMLALPVAVKRRAAGLPGRSGKMSQTSTVSAAYRRSEIRNDRIVAALRLLICMGMFAATLVIGAATVISLAVLSGADVSANQHSGVTSPGQSSMMMESGMTGRGMMGQGMLRLPQMDPARGRKLFASKGCVACHSVNGVGGKHAPPLDATTMEPLMNPFEFAAKMWRGAEAMIYLQREELGEQIEFSGEELADIIAFVHHPEEQAKFSETDIAPRIKNLMKHLKEEEPHEQEGGHGVDTPKE